MLKATLVTSICDSGDLRFFRSQPYIDYFNYLDKAGGFYYERWGDAPVLNPLQTTAGRFDVCAGRRILFAGMPAAPEAQCNVQVHTLGTALLLDPSEVHFFDEIGYEHPPFAHLPVTADAASNGQCMTRAEVEKGRGASSVLDFYGNACLKRWIWRWKGIKVHGTSLPEDASAILQAQR